jgi:Nicotinamide mononucleotide transporter
MTLLTFVSWAGFATTLLGVWMVARKMITGWLMALFSEVLWMWWAAATGSWALFALSSCLVVLNGYGAYRWRKDFTRPI